MEWVNLIIWLVIFIINDLYFYHWEKLTPDITKQERIIDIPPNTEVCHTLDLERVQYVGMPTVDGYVS